MENFIQQYNSLPGTWDEMCNDHTIRTEYSKLFQQLLQLNTAELQQKQIMAADLFMNRGITFTVYNDNEGIERIFPYDIIPRIITGAEWATVEARIKQRLKALIFF